MNVLVERSKIHVNSWPMKVTAMFRAWSSRPKDADNLDIGISAGVADGSRVDVPDRVREPVEERLVVEELDIANAEAEEKEHRSLSLLAEMLEQGWNIRESGTPVVVADSHRHEDVTIRIETDDTDRASLTISLGEEAVLRHQFDCRVHPVVYLGWSCPRSNRDSG